MSLSDNTLLQAAEETPSDENIITSGKGDENSDITWTLYKNGELVVEGTGDFYNTRDNVVYVPWKDYADQIKSATVRVTGASNAEKMFYNCTNLTSVDLTGFDTTNVTSMYGMFYNCKSLTAVDLSGLHTENVTNMADMFEDCSALQTLDLSGLHTENVTNMADMFEDCSALQTLDLSGLHAENVTSMGNMFTGCKALQTLNLSGFKTEKVTQMGSMFWVCSTLTALDLSGFNTQNVTSMGSMFQGCAALTSLDLSNFDTAQTSNFDKMFFGCKALETLDISGFTANGLTSNMLSGCDSLREIKTPKQAVASIALPETDGIYSRRTEDGMKVTELPAEQTTVSVGKKIGVSFTGSNFTLKEFGDKKIEDIEVVFDKGNKKSFTFTVVPEEGYNTTPEVKITTKSTRITVTQGADSPYQFIIAPMDAEQGYMRDESISISVAKSGKYALKFRSLYWDLNGKKLDSAIYESVVVANGEEVTDLTKKLSASYMNVEVEDAVSNEFDTTLYIKVPPQSDNKVRVPAIDIYTSSVLNSKTVKGKISVDSPTELDKKYEQDGYCAVRLGRIYSDTTIRWMNPTVPDASNTHGVYLSAEGFPKGCHVAGYLKDGYKLGGAGRQRGDSFLDR